jgi:hypothetical protein
VEGIHEDMSIHGGIHGVQLVVDQAYNDQGEDVVGGHPISRVPIIDNGKKDSVCEESCRENAMMTWVKA